MILYAGLFRVTRRNCRVALFLFFLVCSLNFLLKQPVHNLNEISISGEPHTYNHSTDKTIPTNHRRVQDKRFSSNSGKFEKRRPLFESQRSQTALLFLSVTSSRYGNAFFVGGA